MYYIPLNIFKNIFKLPPFIFLLVIKEICEKSEHQSIVKKSIRVEI